MEFEILGEYPENPYLHETIEMLIRQYSEEDVRQAIETVLDELENS